MTPAPARKFAVNDRVRIKYASGVALAVVRGFSRDGRVRVQRDGRKTVDARAISPALLERVDP